MPAKFQFKSCQLTTQQSLVNEEGFTTFLEIFWSAQKKILSSLSLTQLKEGPKKTEETWFLSFCHWQKRKAAQKAAKMRMTFTRASTANGPVVGR